MIEIIITILIVSAAAAMFIKSLKCGKLQQL
jgi:hypothetical protein